MKAVKGNKVYTVSEEGAKTYQQQGFDIYDEDGELLQYGAGKTVSYEEYARLKKELEEAKAGDTSSNQEDVLDIQEQMNLMLYLFGLHKTKTVEGDTVHYYIHDKETISSSTAAWHLYQAGGKEQFLVSVDGGSTWRPGYDEQGNPTLPLWDIIVGGI